MRYQEVLSQAYRLTIRNPFLWMFGLVMLGGFNLFLINFFTIVPGGKWKAWPSLMESMAGSPAAGWVVTLLGLAAAFIILNLVKILFIVVAHRLLPGHWSESNPDRSPECDLCAKMKRQVESEVSPPYFAWLGHMLLASGATILLTAGTTLAANAVLSTQGYSPTAVVINLLFIAAITCLIGTWNAFTGYFIVLHNMSFQTASAASIDLLVKHTRRVVEFVILLSVIYSFSVIVGNAFFHVWHFGFIGEAIPAVRLVFLAAFVLWFAINNSFFNIAFLIFFDRTVKAAPAAKEVQQAVVS